MDEIGHRDLKKFTFHSLLRLQSLDIVGYQSKYNWALGLGQALRLLGKPTRVWAYNWVGAELWPERERQAFTGGGRRIPWVDFCSLKVSTQWGSRGTSGYALTFQWRTPGYPLQHPHFQIFGQTSTQCYAEGHPGSLLQYQCNSGYSFTTTET